MRRNVTPLTTARDCEQYAAVAYMWSQSFSPRKKNQKRASSDQPMLERAVKAGVTDRLKPIPQRLLEATTAGRLSRLQQNPCSFLFAAMLGSTEHHHFAEIESCGTNM